MQTEIMSEAQRKIDELHAEADAVEAQAQAEIAHEREEHRQRAYKAQEKINSLIENASALLLQNKNDLLEAIQKAEEAVREAHTIAMWSNSQAGASFLLNESLSLFCGDEIAYLKKLLTRLQIVTPSNVAEGAVKVRVGAAGLTVGYGKEAVHYKADTLLVLPASQADKLLKDHRRIVERVDE